MKVADGIDIKTEHVLALGTVITILYVGKQLTEGAMEGATKGLAKGTAETLTNAIQAIPTAANNFKNTQLEQFFYNNPYAAVLVGHPEWQYMTPAKGYW